MSEFAIDNLEALNYTADDFVLPHMPLIEKIARHMAASSGQHMLDADDLMQEGYLALSKAVSKYNPSTGPFEAFAKVVVQNALANVLRKERLSFEHRLDTYQITVLDDTEDFSARLARFMPDDYTMSPEQIVIRKETYEEVHHALNTVPERDKVYLWYRFGFDGEEERSMAKTAEHFHLSERNGKKTEKEALKKVGTLLKKGVQ